MTLPPELEATAADAARRVAEEREPLVARFPGALGTFLSEFGVFMAMATVSVPWLLFWAGPTSRRPSVETPEIWFIPGVRLWQVQPWQIYLFVVGAALFLVAVMVIVVFPVTFWHSTLAAGYNLLVFGALFAALVGVFSVSYLQLSHNDPKCFGGHHLSHVEALYFTITTFTTTGLGDLAPKTPGCRLTVACQTLVGLAVISMIIATLVTRLLQSGHK
jgi:Ion channel